MNERVDHGASTVDSHRLRVILTNLASLWPFMLQIILCDKCDKGWHMFCLKPKMKKIPKGDWICPACESARRGVDQVNTQEHTLGEFQRRAAEFERKWFVAKGLGSPGRGGGKEGSGGRKKKRGPSKDAKVSDADRVREFWSVVDNGEELATVICGVDPKVQIDRRMDGGETLAGGVGGGQVGTPISGKKRKAGGYRTKKGKEDVDTDVKMEGTIEQGIDMDVDAGSSGGGNAVDTPCTEPRVELGNEAAVDEEAAVVQVEGGDGEDGEDAETQPSSEKPPEVQRIGFMAIGQWKNDLTENLAPYCEVMQAPNGQNRKAVDSPTVEFGMTFSSRPWKVEDQLLYSATYVHSGAGKQWYCIPPYAASMYDDLVHKVHSEYMMSMEWTSPLGPNLMVNPTMLMERGVPVFGCTQEAGTLVICFPNSYTCSFNLGFNISEHMQMVLPDWLRMSSQASSLYRNHRVAPRFSTEKMILNAIEGDNIHNLGSETRYWLHRELARLVEEETLMRYKLWGEGLRQYRQILDGEDPRKGVGQHRDQQACVSCGTPLVYSMIECSCTPKVASCLHHRRHLCRCRADRQRLAWRYSVGELEARVEDLRKSLDPDVVAEIELREKVLNEDVQLCVDEAVAAAKKSEDLLREHVIEGYSERDGGGSGKVSKKKGSKSKKVQAIDQQVTPQPNPVPNGLSTPLTAPRLPSLSPSLTMVAECGYVQGPVRPFEHLDLPPEDFRSLEALKKELEACCQKWIRDAKATLEQGGNLVYELQGLIEEADEYLWATLSEGMRRQVLDLVPKLVDANRYVTNVERALNISNRKTMLEDVENILNRNPKPIQNVPGMSDLQAAVDQAREWIQTHYEPVSDMTCNPPLDSKVFDNVLFEAGKIPVAIQEAKKLRERRDSIKKVAESVRIALPKGREAGRRKGSDEPVTLDFIESLQEEARKAHIMMPEIEYLNETLEKIQDWRQRVEKALEMRLTWEDYEALIQEGKEMPVDMPDIHRLYELRDAVDTWIAAMRDLMGKNQDHKVPLKRLREFLAEGYALPMTFPEIQEMADYIQTFQLEDIALKCMSTSVREEEVREIMDAMSKAGVSNGSASGLSARLKAKLDVAEAWRARASVFSSKSVSSLEEIVREGEATGLKMELLDQLNERLALVHRWIQRCTRCLAGVADDPTRKPVLNPQRSLIVECSHPLMRSRVHFIDPKEREKFPSYAVINTLLSEYDLLKFDLPHLEELRTLQGRAKAWLAEANPILNQTELAEEQVPLVESLIEKGLATGVKIAQVDNLESYVNAYIWQKTAQDLLESFQATSNGPASGPGSAKEVPSQPKVEQEALTAFIAAGDVFASCKHTSVAKGLKKVANLAARWLKEAASILRADKPKPVTREHVVDMLENGKNMPVDVEPVRKEVSDLLAQHDALVEELADVWSVDKEYSYVSERGAALMQNPITSEAKSNVMAALKDMERAWSAPQPEYGSLFATVSTATALETMLAMLSTAHEQIDRIERGENIPDGPVDVGQETGGNRPLPEAQPFCLCQQPAGAGSSVVQCDRCNAWYHNMCVGYGPKPSRGRKPKKKQLEENSMPPFVCPVCVAIDAEDESTDELIQSLSPPLMVYTTRDHLNALKEKVGGTQMFKGLTGKVDAVLKAADAWSTRVEAVLERLTSTSIPLSNSRKFLSATDEKLRQLLISSMAVSYDFLGLCGNLLHHLRVNRWRSKALELVSQEEVSKKPVCTPEFLEQVRSFLARGTASLNINESTDPFYAGIIDAIAQHDAWVDKARELIKRSAEAHTLEWYRLQSQSQGLIKAGLDLPWRVCNEDLSQVKEHLAVHCLCQRMEDGAPMLSCDSCSNWFHFGCVGRREDPSLESEIEHWNCPICCRANAALAAKQTDLLGENLVAYDGKNGLNQHDAENGNALGTKTVPEPTKKGKKRKKKSVPTQAPDPYQSHIPIQGTAKETLTVLEHLLPALSKVLGDPDVHKTALQMYSRAAFQRAVLGRSVPDEAFEAAGERELLEKLEEAVRTAGDGGRGTGECDDDGDRGRGNKILCDAGAPRSMEIDEALQID